MQIVVVENLEKGIKKAKEILYEKVDKRTVLFLSGGNTPRPLYEIMAKEKIIKPVAVGMIDERFVDPLDPKSNEKMIYETGFLNYLEKNNIPFFSMFKKGKTRLKSAELYDQTVRDLFFKFPKSVAVMGMGSDGHTSSIMPNRKNFLNPIFDEKRKDLFVSEINDKNGKYGERVMLTFSGLALIDYFILLVFGKEKKKALQKALEHGSLEEIPARFYNLQASKDTIIITDQFI